MKDTSTNKTPLSPIADTKPDGAQKDLLGRIPFIKNITDLIVGYTNPNSLVIGVEGTWGEGKSFVIEKIRKRFEYKKNYLWITFNPWSFLNHEDLTKQFLIHLATEIRLHTSCPLLKRIREWPSWVSIIFIIIAIITWICLFTLLNSAVTIAVLILVIGPMATIFCSLRHLFSLLKTYANSRTSICPHKLRARIDSALRKYNKKIIIQIEDMDRLPPAQIRDMVQLVRMVADFDHTVYLLGYERSQVIEALSTLSQKENYNERCQDGRGYLQKVVHAAYALPQPKPALVANSVYKKFHTQTQHLFDAHFQQHVYWQEISERLAPLIDNMRLGDRVLNRALTFVIELHKKVMPIDMLVISYIIEEQHDLWQYIEKHWRRIYGAHAYDMISSHIPPSINFEKSETSQVSSPYLDHSIHANDHKREQVLNLIKAVFPQMAIKEKIEVGLFLLDKGEDNPALACNQNLYKFITLTTEGASLITSYIKALTDNKDRNKDIIKDIYAWSHIDFKTFIAEVELYKSNDVKYAEYLHILIASLPKGKDQARLWQLDHLMASLVFPYIDNLIERDLTQELKVFLARYADTPHDCLNSIFILLLILYNNKGLHKGTLKRQDIENQLPCLNKKMNNFLLEENIQKNFIAKISNFLADEEGMFDKPYSGYVYLLFDCVTNYKKTETIKNVLKTRAVNNTYSIICLLHSIIYASRDNNILSINRDWALFLSQQKSHEFQEWFDAIEQNNQQSYMKGYIIDLHDALKHPEVSLIKGP